MKKKLLTLVFTAFCLNLGFAQDIITKKTGEDIQAKVLEITPSEIKFKRFDNLEGPIHSLSKADVLLVHYENNTKEVITEEISYTKPDNNQSLFAKGQMDADRHYRGYTGAGTGTLVTSLVSPLIGLVPAIACSSSEPKDRNLTYPDPNLMQNADYYAGYTTKSKKIKSGKVWKNWAIGLGANIVAIILLSN